MNDLPERRPRAPLFLLLLVALGLLVLGVLARQVQPLRRLLAPGKGETTVTHDVVVEKMRAVAQLVTSETTVRDVVAYENRRLGSTKRSLVVVTGRVLTGIDLDRGTDVQVDHDARRVRIILPHATVLGVEITQLKTYDERSGLWNPFRPADRDTIFRLAREQLVRSAGELEVTEHAEESARRVLRALINPEGYRVEVVFGADRADPKALD
ncbi:MAG: DUF4230 domain-containing protein [Gemmatimonadales bacterium]